MNESGPLSTGPCTRRPVGRPPDAEAAGAADGVGTAETADTSVLPGPVATTAVFPSAVPATPPSAVTAEIAAGDPTETAALPVAALPAAVPLSASAPRGGPPTASTPMLAPEPPAAAIPPAPAPAWTGSPAPAGGRPPRGGRRVAALVVGAVALAVVAFGAGALTRQIGQGAGGTATTVPTASVAPAPSAEHRAPAAGATAEPGPAQQPTADPGGRAPQPGDDGDGSARRGDGQGDSLRSPRPGRSGSQQDDPRSRPAPGATAGDDPGHGFPPPYDEDDDDDDD